MQRDRFGLLHAVAGVAPRARVVQRQPAVDLPVVAVALQPVLLVLVVAQSELHLVPRPAEHPFPVEPQLHAARVVLAGVGAQLDVADHGRTRVRRVARHAVEGAVEDGLQLRGGEVAARAAPVDGRDDVVPGRAHGVAVVVRVGVQALGLEPVALVLVVVGGDRQPGGVAQRELVAQDVLVVLGLDVVELRHAVAAVGIGAEVGVGEAEVALLGILVGVLELEVDLVARAGRGVAQLQRVVLELQPGLALAAVDLLEAVRAPQVRLQQEAEAVRLLVAVPGVAAVGRILPALGQRKAGRRRRDRRRHQIQRAADSVRTLSDGRGALQHLDRMHAPGGREVIGGRRGVRRRRDQDVVLQQRDAAAALGGHAADADVRPQAVAVLGLHVHARRLAEDAVHVGVLELLELLGADEVG